MPTRASGINKGKMEKCVSRKALWLAFIMRAEVNARYGTGQSVMRQGVASFDHMAGSTGR